MKQNQLFYFLIITILFFFTSSHCMQVISIELEQGTSAQSLVCEGEILKVQKYYRRRLKKEVYNYDYSTLNQFKLPRIEKFSTTSYYEKDPEVAIFNELPNKFDLFMNKFVIFSLKQLQLKYPLPSDITKQIIEKAFTIPWVCNIDVGNDVKDIMYDLTGKYAALIYDHQIRFYDIHDIEHLQTNFYTFPYGGFVTFHPNNRTILILRRDDPRKILYGIDLETHKVIYKTSLLKQNGGNNLPKDEILTSCDGYYKKLAINSQGDRLAIASDKTFLAIFAISSTLQNFFKKYNSKTTEDLSIFIRENIFY